MTTKYKFILALVLVLSTGLAVGGSIAHFNDSSMDVNIMVLGNVDIELVEQQRQNPEDPASGLVAFDQDKPMAPAVYRQLGTPQGSVEAGGVSYPVYSDAQVRNAQDKIVSVRNKGVTTAWIRTLFAFEHNDPNGDNDYSDGIAGMVHTICNDQDGVWTTYEGTALDHMEIGGRIYSLASYTYREALPAGRTSAPSLLQVFFDKAVDKSHLTNLGKSYDILVLSQAVQADGFSSAQEALNTSFGEISPVNEAQIAGWFSALTDSSDSPAPDAP